MIDERKINFVIISSHLRRRHPIVSSSIKIALESSGVTVYETPCKNIWTRDYLPIQVGVSSLVKFDYQGYGDNCFKSHPSLKCNPKFWSWIPNVVKSKIRLDGGNLIYGNGVTIVTDIIFRHNPDWKKTHLVSALEGFLQSEIVIIPAEPDDNIGHADGILHFVPGAGRLLVHDYSECGHSYLGYQRRLMSALNRVDCDIVMVPCVSRMTPRLTHGRFRKRFPDADIFNPAFGYYLNIMVAGNCVLIPTFGIEDDAKAVELIRAAFDGFKIFTIDCSELSMEGGLVNCVTMGYCF